MKVLLAFLLLITGYSWATEKPPRGGHDQVIKTTAIASNKAASSSGATVGDQTVTNSNNSGVSVQGQRVPDGYFSYSPNYLDCGRVLGLQFGNSNGVGSLGVPLPRDRSCDIWKAVEEAQQNGHIALSYAFMCEIKNIRTVWGKETCYRFAQEAQAVIATPIAQPNLLAVGWEEEIQEQQAIIIDQQAEIENLRTIVEHTAYKARLAKQTADRVDAKQEQQKADLRAILEKSDG